ncbi:MAG: ferritin family protein [Planctomycetota bacterium]|jgi:rubrerythrin
MEHFESAEEVLDFAIERETESQDFYMKLAERMDNPKMRDVFEKFATEELGHKMKLEAVKHGEILLGQREIMSLGIADYVVDVEPRPDMDYTEALILAMKKEKAAYRMYLDLAAVAEDEELTGMFLSLAQEEAKHKLRFEIEYDDIVMKED